MVKRFIFHSEEGRALIIGGSQHSPRLNELKPCRDYQIAVGSADLPEVGDTFRDGAIDPGCTLNFRRPRTKKEHQHMQVARTCACTHKDGYREHVSISSLRKHFVSVPKIH